MRELGSFRIFWLLGWQIGFVSFFCRAGIGFVLHNWAWKSRRDASGTVNWVRFA